MLSETKREYSSFRDPSGYLYEDGGVLYRRVNKCYLPDYEMLMGSGLYARLVEKRLIIAHEEVEKNHNGVRIKPERIDFISYPYEWSWSQYRDAALLTLEVQKVAFEYGMVLKDASAYNVQFYKGRPIFIDTLSFEKYKEGGPWVAYQQFCKHFFAPLALMHYNDMRLNQLGRVFIDGVPLDMASVILPMRSHMNMGAKVHIHMHAKSQARHASSEGVGKEGTVSKLGFLGLIDSLESTIRKWGKRHKETEWGDYYNNTNYSGESFEKKKELIRSFVKELNPKRLWDLGGNTGVFTRLASDMGVDTVCFDIDPNAVDANYLQVKAKGEERILPLMLDLTNPSGGVGWANQERKGLMARGKADVVMALALIHHLVIGSNVPMGMVAEYFYELSDGLIIEFVPKGDCRVDTLLATREDIFHDYTKEGFEEAFGEFFEVIREEQVEGSLRTLYCMRARQ